MVEEEARLAEFSLAIFEVPSQEGSVTASLVRIGFGEYSYQEDVEALAL